LRKREYYKNYELESSEEEKLEKCIKIGNSDFAR